MECNDVIGLLQVSWLGSHSSLLVPNLRVIGPMVAELYVVYCSLLNA